MPLVLKRDNVVLEFLNSDASVSLSRAQKHVYAVARQFDCDLLQVRIVLRAF